MDVRHELARLLAGREVWQRTGLAFDDRMELLRLLNKGVPPLARCHWGAWTVDPCRSEATWAWPLRYVWSTGDDVDLELRCDRHEGALPCPTAGCAGIAELGWCGEESDLLSPASHPTDPSTVWLCEDCSTGRGEPDAVLRTTQGRVT